MKLYLGQSIDMHQYRLGAHWLGNSSAEKVLGVLMAKELNMSKQWSLAAKTATAYWTVLARV